jgi:hypothetical protein
MPTIPGAIGAFRRQALRDVGGYNTRTLAEDTDLTMALVRSGWKVVYEEKALAWTEAPLKLKQFWRQRYRWSYGTMQAMWAHRDALRDGGASGRFGWIGLPLIGIVLLVIPLLAPLTDLLALCSTRSRWARCGLLRCNSSCTGNCSSSGCSGRCSPSAPVRRWHKLHRTGGAAARLAASATSVPTPRHELTSVGAGEAGS